MQKLTKNITYAVVASESIHIFCCVLPTIFSVLGFLSGLGLIATMPLFMEQAHGIIHDYEIPMIILSAVILVLGWGLYLYSRQISCRTKGSCSHAPCAPKKDNAHKIMMIASILFVFNVFVYFTFHRSYETENHNDTQYSHGHDIHHHYHDEG